MINYEKTLGGFTLISKKIYLIPVVLFIFGFLLLGILSLVLILFLDGKIGFINRNSYNRKPRFNSFHLLGAMMNKPKKSKTTINNVVMLRDSRTKIKRF